MVRVSVSVRHYGLLLGFRDRVMVRVRVRDMVRVMVMVRYNGKQRNGKRRSGPSPRGRRDVPES